MFISVILAFLLSGQNEKNIVIPQEQISRLSWLVIKGSNIG